MLQIKFRRFASEAQDRLPTNDFSVEIEVAQLITTDNSSTVLDEPFVTYLL